MFAELVSVLVVGLLPTSPVTPGGADLVQADFAPAERVVLYGPEGELRRLSGLPLPADAQAAFDQNFAGRTYFSAFALSKDGGWGYATTTNSLEAAHDVALAQCLSQNTNCLVIAEIVPRGYRPPQPGDITVTPFVADFYRNPAGSVQGYVPFSAMAIAEDGAYSLVWGHASQAEADAAALADCETNRTRGLPGLREMSCVLLPGLP